MSDVRTLQDEFQKTLESLRAPALPVTNITDSIDAVPNPISRASPTAAAFVSSLRSGGTQPPAANKCASKSKRKKILILVMVALLVIFGVVIFLKHRKRKTAQVVTPPPALSAAPPHPAQGNQTPQHSPPAAPSQQTPMSHPTIDFSIPGLSNILRATSTLAPSLPSPPVPASADNQSSISRKRPRARAIAETKSIPEPEKKRAGTDVDSAQAKRPAEETKESSANKEEKTSPDPNFTAI